MPSDSNSIESSADDRNAKTTATDPTATTGDLPSDLVDLNDGDVEYAETTFVHETEEHCEAGVAGRAIVGVRTGDGSVLAFVNDDAPAASAALLPSGTVERGDDWATVGRRTVEAKTGLIVEIERPLRIRRVDHTLEGADEPFETTHHVVFRASPTADAPHDTEVDGNGEWPLEWIDELHRGSREGEPQDPNPAIDAAVDDVRLFTV